mmetsp:Transcript_5622/g.13027  ORF Transcript_5622/g.13027 Transcript_5622/m.13027 type:complete len:279 (-) Transcript_5622:636-1472(-)
MGSVIPHGANHRHERIDLVNLAAATGVPIAIRSTVFARATHYAAATELFRQVNHFGVLGRRTRLQTAFSSDFGFCVCVCRLGCLFPQPRVVAGFGIIIRIVIAIAIDIVIVIVIVVAFVVVIVFIPLVVIVIVIAVVAVAIEIAIDFKVVVARSHQHFSNHPGKDGILGVLAVDSLVRDTLVEKISEFFCFIRIHGLPGAGGIQRTTRAAGGRFFLFVAAMDVVVVVVVVVLVVVDEELNLLLSFFLLHEKIVVIVNPGGDNNGVVVAFVVVVVVVLE